MADVLFILVLLELFRLLVIYLEGHRVSVSTMVEVGIVSTLREVIAKGALHIEWPYRCPGPVRRSSGLWVQCSATRAFGTGATYPHTRVNTFRPQVVNP